MTSWQRPISLARPSFTTPDRIDYVTQFIGSHQAPAVKKVSTEALSPDLHITAALSAPTDHRPITVGLVCHS